MGILRHDGYTLLLMLECGTLSELAASIRDSFEEVLSNFILTLVKVTDPPLTIHEQLFVLDDVEAKQRWRFSNGKGSPAGPAYGWGSSAADHLELAWWGEGPST